jgi:hypothetical protein
MNCDCTETERQQHAALEEITDELEDSKRVASELAAIKDYLWPNQTGMPNRHRNALIAIKMREKLMMQQIETLSANATPAELAVDDIAGKPKNNMINLTFGDAIAALKKGARVARAGWNGKGMFIYLKKGSAAEHEPVNPSQIEGIDSHLFDKGDTGTVTRLPNINMRAATGSTVTGWLASQTDILSEDWEIVG